MLSCRSESDPRHAAVAARELLAKRPISRRDAFRLAAIASVAAAAGGAPRAASAAYPTNARILIVGAGAGGISVAVRLLDRLDGARITILDRRETHHYQPGYTLIGAGVWDKDDVLESNAAYIPRDIKWVRETAAEFDPDANRVVTDSGRQIDYDFLVVATGLQLNYGEIEGMNLDLVGREGIGSVYASNEHAARTWQAMQGFVAGGGIGLFTAPATAIKCAGAPLKMMFLANTRLNETGSRGKAEIRFRTGGKSLFSVKAFNDVIVEMCNEKKLMPDYGRSLIALEPGRREATFRTADGTIAERYDFIHVVPPMGAPEAVRNSPLAAQSGGFAAGGWLEVDRHTLRHVRYPNVFGVGDVLGTPFGKTAASVKKQCPATAQNLADAVAGKDPTASYDGYTSCPMITDIGEAMLVEFDYSGEPTPTFPLDPLQPRWIWWLLKTRFLQEFYYQMLRGRTDWV